MLYREVYTFSRNLSNPSNNSSTFNLKATLPKFCNVKFWISKFKYTFFNN